MERCEDLDDIPITSAESFAIYVLTKEHQSKVTKSAPHVIKSEFTGTEL